uniref:KIAA1586 n=1 Tax=Gopherus evgoodei TaxID=1825980 RepID=A0A8C4WSR0_9SAUR
MKRQKSITDWFSSKMTRSLVSSSSSENNDLNTENADDNNFGDENILNVESSENVSAMEEDLHDCENVVPACWTSEQARYFLRKYNGLIIVPWNSQVFCLQRHHIWGSLEENLYTFLQNGKSVLLKHLELIKKLASLRKKMMDHFESSSHLRVINILFESKKEPLTIVIDKLTPKNIAITSKIFNIVYSSVKRNRPMSDMVDEVYKIVENNSKIFIIIDEASTISSKTVLVILLKCELQDSSQTIFLNLVELESTKAKNICNALRCTLTDTGFYTEYLKKNLIGFCSDGMSTMLGHKSGIATRLIQDFPNIIIWHCLNHQLQLALDDAINYINEISHFKFFWTRFMPFFSSQIKVSLNLNKFLKNCILKSSKIGHVFGPQWASCSPGAVKAVWRIYPALYSYFSKNENFSGMAKRLKNKEFLKDLALLIDILDELALSSNALQVRQLIELFSVIDPTSWNIEEVRLPWKSREEKVHELNKFITFVVDLNDFCDYVENNIHSKNLPDPETIRKAKQIMNTIAVSSAEAERAFSLMNIICRNKRPNLTIKHISSFMTINLLGKPLNTRVRVSNTKDYGEDQEAIWNLLPN